MTPEPLLRIGELARRAGVPPATLRAWERRYGIVEPARTEGGYRLYSEEDERRLKRMVELITHGAAPAEAAGRVLAADRGTEAGASADPGAASDVAAALQGLPEQLLGQLSSFDEIGAHRTIDRAVAAYSTEALVDELVLPVLRRTGELWSGGKLTVGQEHFTSNLIRGRMIALTRGWGGGRGPLALLACPPGEEHDLALVCFGLLLRERGWRIAFLGADTPLPTLAETAERLEPQLIVLPVTTPGVGDALAARGPLPLAVRAAVAGPGATRALAEALGAELLATDVTAAAERIAATVA